MLVNTLFPNIFLMRDRFTCEEFDCTDIQVICIFSVVGL